MTGKMNKERDGIIVVGYDYSFFDFSLYTSIYFILLSFIQSFGHISSCQYDVTQALTFREKPATYANNYQLVLCYYENQSLAF